MAEHDIIHDTRLLMAMNSDSYLLEEKFLKILSQGVVEALIVTDLKFKSILWRKTLTQMGI